MRLHGDATVTAIFFYDEGFGAGWGWLGRGLGGARAGFGGVGGVGRWVVYSVLSIRLPSPAAMEVHKATQCFRRGFRQRFRCSGYASGFQRFGSLYGAGCTCKQGGFFWDGSMAKNGVAPRRTGKAILPRENLQITQTSFPEEFFFGG
jgi:hypothetical protein